MSLDGRLHYQDQPIEPEVLQERLKVLVQEKPETAVIVAADKSLPYSKVVSLIDQLKESGVRRLALATAKP
ncbi:biopolymer transport protein ExbD [compost metagenome]